MIPYYDDGTVQIFCGDARDILPCLSADVLVMDPPYGITLRSSRSGAFGDCAVAGDESTALRDAVLAAHLPKPAVVFGTWRVPRPEHTRHVLVWDKGEHVGMGDLQFPWKPNWEEIYVIGDGFRGARTGSVLRYHAIAGTVAVTQGRHHPTEKPVALMRELIHKCPPGVIVDPFAGSGTTGRAAKDLGRKAILIELEERYCEIAARRMEQSVLPLEALT